MKREKTDVLVIGAGPSGTVAASMVNKGGLKVKIVEKQKFPPNLTVAIARITK